MMSAGRWGCFSRGVRGQVYIWGGISSTSAVKVRPIKAAFPQQRRGFVATFTDGKEQPDKLAAVSD